MSAISRAQRTEELLNRLADLRVDTGLAEPDVSGHECREPLRTAAIRLTDLLWTIKPQLPSVDRSVLHQQLCNVRDAADTEAAASEGRLDAALAAVATTVSGLPITTQQRLEVLEALSGTIQAALMVLSKSPPSTTTTSEPTTQKEQQPVVESCCASDLIRLIATNATATSSTSAVQTLQSIQESLANIEQQLPDSFHAPPCQASSLNPSQQQTLKELHAALEKEYTLRRNMLLERAKVTLGSFLWAIQNNQEDTEKVENADNRPDDATMALSQLSSQPNVDFNDVFTTTLGQILVSASAPVTRTSTGGASKMKQMLIGKVPDRGGRSGESRSRANMPAWSARRASAPKTGGGGKGGGNKPKQGGGSGGKPKHIQKKPKTSKQ